MPSFYPIHINIKGRKCLVVGGGKTAERKVNRLVRYGGKVVVVSPVVTSSIENLSYKKRVVWYKRGYRSTDLHQAFLVFCATNNQELNKKISRKAKRKGILVNVVDSLSECSFISPALVERGCLTISISTEGLAPLLSRKIRKELGISYGQEYRHYTKLIAQARNTIVRDKGISAREKRKRLECLLSMNLISRLKSGERVTPQKVLKALERSEIC
jgi:precorrin-2 dehydrogenase/sirohydrochlorin ferrochelatase